MVRRILSSLILLLPAHKIHALLRQIQIQPRYEQVEPFDTHIDELEKYVRYSGKGVCARNDRDGRIYLIADNI